MDSLTVLLAAWGLLCPWTLVALRLLPQRGFYDRVLAGLVGGLAATVALGYALAMMGWLGYFRVVYGAAWIAAVWMLVGAAPKVRWPDGIGWMASALGAAVFAQAVPVFSTEYPMGWDPTFHLILARKILESGALCADWGPFEPIPVNYTQGLHVLVAIVADFAGAPVHIAFQMLHLVFQPLACVLVLRLAVLIYGDFRVGALALLAYEFLCSHGSFSSYYQWGGLPTELGSVFFLGIVWTALGGRDRRGTVLAVLYYGGLVMTHHLSGLIATWVLAFYWVVSRLGGEDGALRGWLVRLWPLTLAIYSFYIAPYVLERMGNLGHTDVLRFYDDDFKTGWQVALDMGPAALSLGLLGIWWANRRPTRVVESFLLSWFCALILGFGLLGYAYRLAAHVIYGEQFTAFTPSRFMTVAAYPLAVYAGYALWRLAEVLAARFSLRMDVILLATCACIVLGSVPGVVRLAGLRSVTEEGAALGRRIEAQVPESGFVLYTAEALNRMQPYPWISYLTWRRSVYTPIPASENRQLLRQIREEMWELKLSRIPQWVASAELPIFFAEVDEETGEVQLKRQTENAK